MNDIEQSGRDYFKNYLEDGHPSSTILYIGCVDSRVVPELLLGKVPGEVIVVRVPGALVPPQGLGDAGVTSGVELALGRVESLTDIIVCGHTDCLMLKAMAEGASPLDEPNLARWISMSNFVQAQASTRADQLNDQTSYRQALLEVSVERSLAALRELPVVREKERTGQIKLHGWYFDLHTGRVYALKDGQFVTLGAGDEDLTKSPSTQGASIGQQISSVRPEPVEMPSVAPASVEPPSVEPDSVEPQPAPPERVKVPKAQPVQRVYASDVSKIDAEKPQIIEQAPRPQPTLPPNVVEAVNDPALDNLKQVLNQLELPSGRMKARQALDNIRQPQSWRDVARLVREMRDPNVRRALREIAFELRNPQSRTELRKILASVSPDPIEDLRNLSADDVLNEFQRLFNPKDEDK